MQKLQCSTLKIATCDFFSKNTKIFSSFQKNSKTMHCTKNVIKKVFALPFRSLYQIWEDFLGSIIFFFFQNRFGALKLFSNTN